MIWSLFARWSHGRQNLVGDRIADGDRFAGRVGFLLRHRTGLVPGTSASPSSLVMATASGLFSNISARFKGGRSWIVPRPYTSDNDGKRGGEVPYSAAKGSRPVTGSPAHAPIKKRRPF